MGKRWNSANSPKSEIQGEFALSLWVLEISISLTSSLVFNPRLHPLCTPVIPLVRIQNSFLLPPASSPALSGTQLSTKAQNAYPMSLCLSVVCRGASKTTHTLHPSATRHPRLPTPPHHTLICCAPHAHPLLPTAMAFVPVSVFWFFGLRIAKGRY